MKGRKDKMKGYYGITETAHLLGVTTQTIRNWEKSGEFLPDYRSPGGHRYYSSESIDKRLESSEMKKGSKYVVALLGNGSEYSKREKKELIIKYLTAQGRPYNIYDKDDNEYMESVISDVVCGRAIKIVAFSDEDTPYKDKEFHDSDYDRLLDYVLNASDVKIEVIKRG